MQVAETPFHKGLSGRLLAALAFVALISVGGLGLAAYLNQRAALETQVKAQLTSIANLKEEQIITWLNERQADARLLAVNELNQDHFTQVLSPEIAPEQKTKLAEFLTDNLIGMQQSRAGYSEIAFIDTQGTVVVATDPALVGQPTQQSQAFAKTMRAPEGAYTQDIHYDPDTGLTNMAFGHVVRAIDLNTGQEMPNVIGVVIITVNMDETIYPLIRAWPGMGTTGETLLIRSEGDSTLFLNNLRFNNNAALNLRIPASSADAKPAHYAARGREGIIQTSDYRGAPVLAAYRHIPGVNWGFVAKEDLNEAFAPVNALTYRIAWIALGVLLAAGLVSIAISRTLTRPLAQLVQATQAVAAGNLSTKINITRDDEIGALADSFRAMVHSLEQRQQQIEAANQAIRGNASQLKTASQILHHLNATPNINQAFPEIVGGLRQILNFETISLDLLDKENQRLTIVAIDQPRIVPLQGPSIAVTDTAAADDLLAGRPRLTPHLATEIEYPAEKMLYEAGYRSRISLPLRIEERSIGMLNFSWLEPKGYDTAQIPLLSQIANAIALALERSRLFDETRHRSAELSALHQLSLAVNSSLQPSQVLQMAVDHSVELLKASRAGIFLLNDQGNLQVGSSSATSPSITTSERLAMANFLWEQFAAEGEPFQVIQPAELVKKFSGFEQLRQEGIESIELLRLTTPSGIALGMLAVLVPRPNIASDEAQLAQTIAQIISPAIAHAQSFHLTYEQLEQTNRRLTLVNQISRRLSAILDVEQLLREVVPLVQSGLGYAHVGIGTLKGDEITFQVITNSQTRLPEIKLSLDTPSIAGWVITHNQALLVPDVTQDDRYHHRPEINISSALAVPIRLAEQVLGVLMVAGDEPAAFDHQDQELLQAIADQLALAMQNAKLYGQMRQRAIKALQESEERLRSIYNAANDAIFLIDPEHHRIIDANPKASKMLGYTQEELSGLQVQEIHPNDMALITRQWSKTLQNGVGQSNELTCLTKSGQTIPAEAAFSRVQIRERHYVLAMVRDVTRRKQLEEQLRQSQKMEAIGQLAGGVAHDFNNLLTVITGYSELLIQQAADENMRQDVEQIQKAGERAVTLTRQLLAFSRKQVLQPKVLDLNTIVTDMEKMLRRLIGEDVELVTDLAAPLRRVKADPGQIEQVVMNLAVNARDAMPRGGKLTIATDNVVLDDSQARHPLNFKPGRYVLLAVSDTGIGMDTQTQARIFEPFFTTKGPAKGTGLGLATVYGIVTQSGGTIRVESRPGRGTTFKIYLPQIEALEQESPKSTPQQEAAPDGSETILLVEDAADVRRLARDTLQRHGYRVLEANNGQEALQVGRQHKPINLLLTDVVMPQMSGPELAQCLAPLHPKMQVLYMSGYTDNPIVQQEVVGPGTAFIQKPFTPTGLARRVRAMLDKAPLPVPPAQLETHAGGKAARPEQSAV